LTIETIARLDPHKWNIGVVELLGDRAALLSIATQDKVVARALDREISHHRPPRRLALRMKERDQHSLGNPDLKRENSGINCDAVYLGRIANSIRR